MAETRTAEPSNIVCSLCGEPIVKTKGEREEVYKQELAQHIHHSCSTKHEEILSAHQVRQSDYSNVLFEGMTQLLRLENTEPVKAFTKRLAEAKAEVYEEFPYRAEQDKAMEETGAQAVKVKQKKGKRKQKEGTK